MPSLKSHCTTTTIIRICLVFLLAGGILVEASDPPSSTTPTANEAKNDPLAQIIAAGPEDDFALTSLEHLCDSIGPRLSGSPAMDAAIEFSVKSLREAGFDRVWTEPVMVPAWERGFENARVTAPNPYPLPISGLGRSIGTPEGGIEAEVLVVSDFAELEARADEAQGRIVLFDPLWQGYGATVGYRFRGASAAAKYGAVAVLVRSLTGSSLATLHTGVMGYEDDVPKIPAASITVEDATRIHRMTARGITVKVHLRMSARNLPEKEQANVIAEIEGSEWPEEIVLVGGHLDSWDVGTGAHDDGAGCAIAVGAVNLIHKIGLRPKRTLRVVLFASEEFGGISGETYLKAHHDELDHHIAAIESDSGSFAPDGFSARTTPAVLTRLQKMATVLEPFGANKVIEGWAGVDIGPIVEQGVPGLAHRTQNEHYFDYHHSPADTFDKIDPQDLAANVTTVAAMLWLIADDPVSLRE